MAPFERKNSKGFTLIELLVVVGIVAVLMSMVVPAVAAARAMAIRAACGSNLRQIGNAVRLYGMDWKDAIHSPQGRWRWVTTTTPAELLNPNNANAYWGVAYLPYAAGPSTIAAKGPGAGERIHHAARVFGCPGARVMSTASGNAAPQPPGSYGVNYMICGQPASTKWRKYHSFRRPSETIFAHDSVAHRIAAVIDLGGALEPQSGQALSNFGTGQNLWAWRKGGQFAELVFPGSDVGVREYYRHRGKCQVLWLDGHVSLIAESDGSDVPPDWYWGRGTRPK